MLAHDSDTSYSRHALIFPWGQHPKPGAPGRELYIVPVLKDQPVPEFIELLDDHHLPKERTENVLVGIFVLNKGKLAATGTPPVPNPAPKTFNIPATTPVPPNAVPYPPNPSARANAPVAPPGPGTFDQSALAAEVASLTPEQISLMLRHLQQTAPQLAAIAGQAAATGTAGYPPTMPSNPNPIPPYNQQHPYPQPPPGPGPGGPYPYASSPERPNGDFDRPSKQVGRDERGRRGRGRPKGGRGRGGRDSSFDDALPADSGWRGRGRGGGPQFNRTGRY